jgi:hypothetical protein
MCLVGTILQNTSTAHRWKNLTNICCDKISVAKEGCRAHKILPRNVGVIIFWQNANVMTGYASETNNGTI